MLENYSKLYFYGFIILATILEVGADILFKNWTLKNRNLLLFSGLALYFIGTVFWAISLKFESISKSISIFTILNLIIIVLIGVFLFKEKLSILNIIGLILGIISLILLDID